MHIKKMDAHRNVHPTMALKQRGEGIRLGDRRSWDLLRGQTSVGATPPPCETARP